MWDSDDYLDVWYGVLSVVAGVGLRAVTYPEGGHTEPRRLDGYRNSTMQGLLGRKLYYGNRCDGTCEFRNQVGRVRRGFISRI